jgi:hypothetical protein
MGGPLLLGIVARTAAAQRDVPPRDFGQRWEVTVETQKATIGDPVTVRFRVLPTERDLLTDTVPHPPDSLPDGVRVLEVEKLKRGADQAWTGRAKLAFYRPGTQRVPSFTLPFIRIVANIRSIIISDSTTDVEITPTVPAGNPPLKDIKPLERIGAPARWPWLVVIVAGALAAVWLRRRRRDRAAAAIAVPEPVDAGPGAVVLGPYEVALARLAQAEREHWPARGEVARHYEVVADALRRYLQEAEGVPALEQTTAELVWALPASLSESGLREAAHEFFGDADLVKFARVRPDELDAARFLRAARALLGRWHAAAGAPREASDAVR